MNNEQKKLKPVIFFKGRNVGYYAQNTYQQQLLLEAMTVSDDPKVWRKMAKLKTIAEVYRTLDKIAMRKEFHESLGRQDVTFDFIVKGIKQLTESDVSDSVRLKAFQTLLRSIGLDKYDQVVESSKTWEDIMQETMGGQDISQLPEAKPIKYDVVQPVIPQLEAGKVIGDREREREMGKELYEK